MEKIVFRQMDGTDTRQGDYVLSNLVFPAEKDQSIGICGQQRRRYLREHHRILYYNLLTARKLNGHLVGIDQQTEELFSQLLKQSAVAEDIAEQFKANRQMELVSESVPEIV